MRVRGKAFLFLAALAALAAWYWWRSRQSSEEIARLQAIRDSLRVKVAAVVRADPNLREAPPGNVLIGMPVAAATRLVQQVTEGFFDEIELVLRNIKVHKAGSVKLKAGFLTIRPGDYVLDLTIDEAHALLKPSRPRVDFKGNWFGVALPVRVARGEGRTTLRFRWDSKRTAGLICDDFEFTKTLTGSVRPRTYDVVGGFDLSVRDGRLVAAPKFEGPGLVVQVSVEPSAATWAFVDQVVKERPAGCEKALKMIDLRKVLGGLLEKGFRVKVPGKIFRPIDLPAGLERSVTIEGKRYALSLKPTGLKLSPGVLWYGADVAVGQAEESAAAAAPEMPVEPPESPAPPPPPPSPPPRPEPSPTPPPRSERMEDRQVAAVTHMMNAVNAGDAQSYASLYSQDAVITIHGSGELKGRDAIEQYEAELLRAFPSARLSFYAIWQKGPLAVVHYAVNGQTPGGQSMGHEGLLFYRFHDTGLIEEERRYLDSLTPLAQMGLLGERPARPLPTLPTQLKAHVAKGSPDEEENVATVTAGLAALNSKDEPALLAMVAEDFVLDELVVPQASFGKESLKARFETWTRAVPDANSEISTILGVGEFVLVETVMRGTLRGPLGRLVASDKPFAVHHAAIVHVKSGEVTRVTGFMNGKELAEAVGQWTPPGTQGQPSQ